MVKVMETSGENSSAFEVVFRGEDDAEEIRNEMQPATSDLDTTIVTGWTYRWMRGMDGNSTVNAVMPPEEDSPLRETQSDPFKKPRWLRDASTLSFLIGGMVMFCVVITVALIVQILVGSPQLPPHSGVLSDDAECSKMGLDLLKESSKKRVEDATSTDAAILTSLCLMVKNPHKGGLGGGGFMLIEEQLKDKEHLTEINFREMSPANVNVNLNVSKDQVPNYQSVAVPGYLSGIKKAHHLFGRKPLKDLFDKAAHLASDGVTVNKELAEAIGHLKNTNIPDDLKSLLTKDDNATFLGVNDVLKQPTLSQTLRAIGEDVDSFHSGSLGRSIQSTLQSLGSLITLDDMTSYLPDVKTDVLSFKYKNMSVAASGVPSSGPVLLSTLHHMEYNDVLSTVNNMLFHEMIESLKFSYGYQASWGNDSEFNELLSNETVEDQIKASGVYSLSEYTDGVQPLDLNRGGEQHVTVIGQDRSIVTMSTGIGSPFGSKILIAGFLMNNAMLDFSWNGKNPSYDANGLKPSEVNFLTPRKKPASSMFAALVLPSDTKCGLYLAFDTHDWTSAISSTVQVIAGKVTGNDIQSSIDARRVSQKMVPFRTLAENSTAPDDLIQFLQSLGHNVTIVPSLGVCSAIQYLEGKITFQGDKRDDEDAAQIF